MKVILVLLLVAVLASLAGAGVFMLKRPGHDRKGKEGAMARALALRVALSISAFLILMLSWYLGWIQPTGIPIAN